MNWAMNSVNLSLNEVTIQPLSTVSLKTTAIALHDPTGWFATHWDWNTPEKIEFQLRKELAGHHKGLCNPFVYLYRGEIAGISRFMRVDSNNRSLEIGGTLVAQRWRRTGVNTSVKYQLLKFAFETLNTERIEFRVDCRNYTSQIAVLRIGAQTEGTLRNRQAYLDGKVRDGYLYSITKGDWPRVKIHLEALLSEKPSSLSLLKPLLNFDDYSMKKFELSDASALQSLVKRNQADVNLDFPGSALIQDAESARKAIAERAHGFSQGTDFFYGIWKQQKLIGQIQVKNLNLANESADVGYYIDSEYRRNGVANKSLEKLTDHLWSTGKIHRLIARARPENEASKQLLAKAGFQFEGTHRSAFRTGLGNWSDVDVFAKIVIQQ